MTRFMPIVLASALVAFVLTPLSRRLARRIGYVDHPGTQKIHIAPMPLLGGLAIYLALVIGLLVLNLGRPQREAFAIVLAVSVVALVGLWDDRYGMDPIVKLGGQVLAGVVLMIGGIQTHLFPWPALDVMLTLFWVVGISNAINLIDNMDGLAAGVAVVSAGFFLWLASLEGQILVAGLAAAICGAALGFLFWNFHPALTFMGDVGSLVLGLTLAILGIKLSFPASPASATWMIPILVLGVPIFDTTLVVISRIRRRVPVYLGGSDHTSHRLVRLGLSHSRAVMSLYLAGALLGLAAIGVRGYSPFFANLTFAALVLAGAVAIVLLERVKLDVPLDDPGIVVIPAGGGARQAIGAARGLSGRVTVVLHPGAKNEPSCLSPSEVAACFSALAEDAASVATTLDGWACPPGCFSGRVGAANVALRLQGEVRMAIDDSADGVTTESGGARVNPHVLELIRRAPMILVGPGELRQNALPAVTTPEIADALRACKGVLVLAVNGQPDATGLETNLFTHRVHVAADEPVHELSRRLRQILAVGTRSRRAEETLESDASE